MSIRAVLWDFGGVLTTSPFEAFRHFEEANKLPRDFIRTINAERNKNAFGMMMSINMLIETGKGFDYTFADFNKWAKVVGFSSTKIIQLAGPSSAAIAFK